MNIVLGLAPVHDAEFQNYPTPATAFEAYVETCRSLEPHLIRIYPSEEEFV